LFYYTLVTHLLYYFKGNVFEDGIALYAQSILQTHNFLCMGALS
jgi:hypothetical protein